MDPDQGQPDQAGTVSTSEQAQNMLAELPQSKDFPEFSIGDSGKPADISEQTQEAPSLSDFAQGVLNDIPESDRETVAKYLNKWDAGVTRRFQEVQSTYAPFKSLADEGYTAEDLELATKLYSLLEENPESALQMLSETLGVQVGSGPVQNKSDGLDDRETYALPKEVQDQLANVNRFMETMALERQQQSAYSQQEVEDSQLDEYLSLLKQEKGDFDESYVLSKMAAGIDGGVAVDDYLNLVQSIQNSSPQRMSAPPILNGGSAPIGTKPITQATEKERKDLISQMLQQANKSGS